MENSLSFIPLLLVVFLAFLVPLLLNRFRSLRLPIVVGEILAGILIGRSGLRLVAEHEPMLDLLAELGFVFLMYHFGMFFFNRLKAVRRILEELSHASAQIKVRAAFTMMLIFVALSEFLGAEVILGAFPAAGSIKGGVIEHRSLLEIIN